MNRATVTPHFKHAFFCRCCCCDVKGSSGCARPKAHNAWLHSHSVQRKVAPTHYACSRRASLQLEPHGGVGGSPTHTGHKALAESHNTSCNEIALLVNNRCSTCSAAQSASWRQFKRMADIEILETVQITTGVTKVGEVLERPASGYVSSNTALPPFYIRRRFS